MAPPIPSAVLRFRDVIQRVLPWWLSDRPTKKRDVGFRYVWAMVAVLDGLQDCLFQGIQAAWPGVGTPTALGYIGRSRGILRGQADTDEEYAAKLIAYLDRLEDAGSMLGIARELHEYLGNHPCVRVVNRAGRWVTIAEDGTITQTTAAWDWDSVSNPERAGFWSELWIIIYPTQWAFTGKWGSRGKWGTHDGGIGHRVTRQEVDAVKAIIGDWKGAHSKVRAVIWTSDATLFDPAVPASCPDGTWGQWSQRGTSGVRGPSGRNLTSCRYWENLE